MKIRLFLISFIIGLTSYGQNSSPCPSPLFYIVDSTGIEIITMDSLHLANAIGYTSLKPCEDQKIIIVKSTVLISGIPGRGESEGNELGKSAISLCRQSKALRQVGVVQVSYHNGDGNIQHITIQIHYE